MIENRYLIVAMVIAFILTPYSVAVFAAALFLERKFRYAKVPLTIGIPGALILHKGIVAGSTITFLSFITVEDILTYSWHFNTETWLKSDLVSTGIALIALAVTYAYTPICTAEKRLLYEAERREKERMRQYKVDKIDYLNKYHQLCVGVSGGGKTAWMAKVIEQILMYTNDFIVFLDGKGGIEEFSIYESLVILAKRFNRVLYIVNVSDNSFIKGNPYGPFNDITNIHAVKDMLVEMMNTDESITKSDAANHYITMLERWILIVLKFMKKYKITITVLSVVRLLDCDYLKDFVISKKQISADDKKYILKKIDEYKDDVQAEVEKLKINLSGVGEEIFDIRNGESFSLISAYKENAIVLFMLDRLTMTKLSVAVARLVTMDLRNLAAARLAKKVDMDRRCWFFMDEFSGYANKLMLDIVNKVRSAGCTCILGTQSISDIQALGVSFYKSVLNCCNRFIIFRQNDGESAEEIAGLISTGFSVSQTLRTTDGVVTGEGSSTVERQYIIHPDYIKGLNDNHGILVGKSPNKIELFKNRFVPRGKRYEWWFKKTHRPDNKQ